MCKPEEYEAAAKLRALAREMPCAYCGEPMVHGDPLRHPTRDHIWPKAVRSMSAGRVGKIWCCAKCNGAKGDMMPSEWLAKITAAADPHQSPEDRPWPPA